MNNTNIAEVLIEVGQQMHTLKESRDSFEYELEVSNKELKKAQEQVKRLEGIVAEQRLTIDKINAQHKQYKEKEHSLLTVLLDTVEQVHRTGKINAKKFLRSANQTINTYNKL